MEQFKSCEAYEQKPFYLKAREAVEYYSTDVSELQDLLALIVGPRVDEMTCFQLASLGVRKLSELSKHELMEYEGVSERVALQIIGAFGLAKKWQQSRKPLRTIIRSPEDVAKCMNYIRFLQQEHFVCLYLNTKNEVIGEDVISKGTIDGTVVHPRDVFLKAIKRNSKHFIAVHNHPSGHSVASEQDRQIASRLSEAGQMIGIEMVDFVIIGDENYTSFREKGYIQGSREENWNGSF